MENHSYDNYFGMLGRGDGFTLDTDGRPPTANADARGNPVRSFHMANTCQAHRRASSGTTCTPSGTTASMDGFVRSASGPAAMGYWDGADIPFYYGDGQDLPGLRPLVRVVLGQTIPTAASCCAARRWAPSTRLSGENDVPAPPNGTIVEMLNRNDISWIDYNAVIPSLFLFPDVYAKIPDKARRSISSSSTRLRASCPRSAFVESELREAVRGGSAGHLDGRRRSRPR